MKISTNLGELIRVHGPEKAIKLLAKAGFEAYDFTMSEFIGFNWAKNEATFMKDTPILTEDYKAYAKHLREVADSCGIVCNQTHAPFPSDAPAILERLKWAIDITAILGGRQCIIHPAAFASVEENVKMYRSLLPYAKERNVRLATENMWSWDKEKGHAAAAACSNHNSFAELVRAVDDEYLISCLDIGHAEMRGLDTDAVKMIEALADSLEALHVHDNDKWRDRHATPFTMDIDFEAICKALKRVGYKGDMTLEIMHDMEKIADEEGALAWVSELASVAKKLRKMFEEA